MSEANDAKLEERFTLYRKIQMGEPLSLREWWLATFQALTQAIYRSCWRVRLTPALRERCVDYAIRAGAGQPHGYDHNVEQTAQNLAEYIAKGQRIQ